MFNSLLSGSSASAASASSADVHSTQMYLGVPAPLLPPAQQMSRSPSRCDSASSFRSARPAAAAPGATLRHGVGKCGRACAGATPSELQQKDFDLQVSLDKRPRQVRRALFPKGRDVASIPMEVTPKFSSHQIGMIISDERGPWSSYETKQVGRGPPGVTDRQLLGPRSSSVAEMIGGSSGSRSSTTHPIRPISAADPRSADGRRELSRPQSAAELRRGISIPVLQEHQEHLRPLLTSADALLPEKRDFTKSLKTATFYSAQDNLVSHKGTSLSAQSHKYIITDGHEGVAAPVKSTRQSGGSKNSGAPTWGAKRGGIPSRTAPSGGARGAGGAKSGVGTRSGSAKGGGGEAPAPPSPGAAIEGMTAGASTPSGSSISGLAFQDAGASPSRAPAAEDDERVKQPTYAHRCLYARPSSRSSAPGPEFISYGRTSPLPWNASRQVASLAGVVI